MVKKKVGGGKRYQAAVKAKSQGQAPDAEAPAWDGPAPPKHLQRKISRKVNFLDKVAASKNASLAAKGAISKKRKSTALTDLSTLAGSVKELLQEQQGALLAPAKGQVKRGAKAKAAAGKVAGAPQKKFGEAVGTLRARAAIMAKESARAQQVLQHPLYQEDPITAITNHLNVTLPPAPAPPKPKTDGKRARKRKGGAKAGGAAEMEQ